MGREPLVPSPFFFIMKKYKILVCPANDGGCAYYRAWGPFKKLQEQFPDRVEVRYNKNPLGLLEEGEKAGTWDLDWDFADMHWADIVMTQNISNFGGQYTARIVGKAKEFGKFVHFDTDDLLTDLYEGHRLKKVYKDKGLEDITKFIYNNSDLVTVTQKKFAERVAPFMGTGVLAVVKNAVDYTMPSWSGNRIPADRKNLCRFGWAGGIHHEEDVKEFAGIPHLVNGRAGRERCQWDFYGCPPIAPDDAKEQWQLDVWKNYKRILLSGFRGAQNWNIFNAVGAEVYGHFFARMDVALAPLQMNAFNDSKSDIKVAECGRYRVPLVASNVGCYSDTIINGETGYLIDPNAPKSEWVKVLTRLAKDKKHREELGENLHSITEELFDLNKVAKNRIDLYDHCFTGEEIACQTQEK